jgi:lipopolysaccharide/colanic/teichoic acid biosynthesis glycosyltransferase
MALIQTTPTLSSTAAAPAVAEAALRRPVSAASPADGQLNLGGRTIWGMDPLSLQQRYWAAYGVQVVRQGEPSQIIESAELFLLTDPRSLVLFKMIDVIDTLNWVQPTVLFVRLHDSRERGYRERVVTDTDGRFLRFQRLYDAAEDQRLARVVLTPDREVARLWQSAPNPLSGWRRLRRFTPRHERSTLSVDGNVFDGTMDREVSLYLKELMPVWQRPDSTITRARQVDLSSWADPDAHIEPGARFIGPVWVGAGRNVPDGTTVIGPAILWDDPAHRPKSDAIQWLTIEPADNRIPEDPNVRHANALDRASKRAFDIVASLIAIALSLPLYPFVALAIWLEDGRPIFFAHRRETLGGREFPCIKFRSMRKDAEKMKAGLKAHNQADGPQFFIEEDPRLTRVGRVLRKYHLDEWPQFFNVLVGHMSIVGPRPSPHSENQYCPAWREARLSVRPGITGLWQTRRTRTAGNDFQEWIKYDIQYVETRSWKLDLLIILKTISQILRRVSRS